MAVQGCPALKEIRAQEVPVDTRVLKATRACTENATINNVLENINLRIIYKFGHILEECSRNSFLSERMVIPLPKAF